MNKKILYVPLLFIPLAVQAQVLSLFESIENEAEPQGPVQINAGSPLQQNGQPAFTLKGASRFGDNYKAILLSRDGHEVQVQWQAGQRVPVPGYQNFQITAVDGRQVTLLNPGQDICIENTSVGVSCMSPSQSLLTLSNAAPLAVSANGAAPAQLVDAAAIFGNGEALTEGPGGVMINANGQQVFRNPFSGELEVAEQQLSPEELAARAERQAARRGRLSNFQPERISEADVPPGMRLVRTPFGDRIVPVRE